MADKEQEERKRREIQAKLRAQQERRSVSYIDDDGCEVTATSDGHIFFNVADWW